jgi:hypothetical protein
LRLALCRLPAGYHAISKSEKCQGSGDSIPGDNCRRYRLLICIIAGALYNNAMSYEAAMGADRIRLPLPAKPTIDEVFQHFLEDQTGSLAPATQRRYASVIQLFTISMNNYAYQPLSKAEKMIFDRFYNAKGDDHREFCQVFGPDRIPENVGEFLGYFMPRKVFDSKVLKQAARVVIRRLAKWLHKHDHIDAESVAVMVARSKAR